MDVDAICEAAADVAFYLGAEGLDLRAFSIEADGNWLQAFGARVLFVAQIIASVVAIPLLLLGTILVASFALCFGESGDAWNMLKEGTKVGICNLSMIPTMFIATFAPHSYNWTAPLSQTLECVDH